MNNGDAFFSFRSASSRDGNCAEDILTIFPGLATYTSQGLAQAIENALEGQLLPDRVIILCGLPDFARLSDDANNSPDLSAAIERGRTIKSFVLAAYDMTGEIAEQIVLRGNSVTNLSATQIALSGVEALFKKNGAAILVRAQHGFLFAKPSSKRSNYFIRAEGLLLELADTSFLAFFLLRFLDGWIKAKNRNPGTVYVDSMSIATLAMALIEMRRRLDKCFGYPRITSFHSYEGLSNMGSPPRDSAICIISASTSCNLADEWKKKFRTGGEEVVTLLSLVAKDGDNKVVYTIPKPIDYISLLDTEDHSGYRLIRVSGEHFWVEAFPSRSVTLTKKNHCPERLPKDMEVFVASGAVDCRRRPTPTGPIRAVHVSGAKLITQADFRSWIEAAVEQQIPASVSRVIYQDDEASKELALVILDLIAKSLGFSKEIILQSDQELGCTEETWKGAAVVVAAVVGKGSRLLSISRDLRDRQESGARIYLIGAAIAPTAKTIEGLRNNLRYSNDQDRYEVHIYRPVAVGNEGILDSWDAEVRTLNEILTESEDPVLKQRHAILQRTGDGLKEQAFFESSCSGLSLTLRDEFAFWEFDYMGGGGLTSSQADVFLTMCRVLQHSRESNGIAHENRLSSEVFQHVVLSPGCFSRFNDGIIQGALLRGCFRSELDYRGDSDLSEEMAAIVLRIIQSYEAERGEASLEFLMALACERLRLEARSLSNVLSALGKEKSYEDYPPHFRILLSRVENLSGQHE